MGSLLGALITGFGVMKLYQKYHRNTDLEEKLLSCDTQDYFKLNDELAMSILNSQPKSERKAQQKNQKAVVSYSIKKKSR